MIKNSVLIGVLKARVVQVGMRYPLGAQERKEVEEALARAQGLEALARAVRVAMLNPDNHGNAWDRVWRAVRRLDKDTRDK
jgi:hypothetical protein